jgi:RimJ/RimL family protein N-acetyltransferase
MQLETPLTLVTSRLTLRAPTIDDFDDSAAMWGDPNVARFIGGRPFSPEAVWSRLLRYLGHWEALGYGYWTVLESGTGGFVGEVGFANYKREIIPSLGDKPECGWVLASWAHGRGYATEAVTAALAWADRNLSGPRTVCIIRPGHAASIYIAERHGYVEHAEGDYRGGPIKLLERTNPSVRPSS